MKLEKNSMRSLNAVIVLAGFLGLLPSLYLFGFCFSTTLALLGIAFIFCLFIIPHTYRQWKEHGKPKQRLKIARVIGIGALVAAYAVPALLLAGNNEPLLYPVKKQLFTAVVQHWYNTDILPDKLPKAYEKYCFCTRPSFLSPDPTQNKWLFLETDAEYLEKYETMLKTIPDLERSENHPFTEEEQKEAEENGNYQLACYQNVPQRVWYELRTTGFPDDLSRAVVYQNDDCGAVLCRETGLLMIWN